MTVYEVYRIIGNLRGCTERLSRAMYTRNGLDEIRGEDEQEVGFLLENIRNVVNDAFLYLEADPSRYFAIRQKPLDEDYLAAIEDRANRASNGPWELVEKEPETKPARWGHKYHINRAEFLDTTLVEGDDPVQSWQDASFTAAAREDVPALVREIRRLQVENELLHRDRITQERNEFARQKKVKTKKPTS